MVASTVPLSLEVSSAFGLVLMGVLGMTISPKREIQSQRSDIAGVHTTYRFVRTR